MTVLYRKYRPQKLSEMAGQEHIIENLLDAFKNGKISHAYLFTGPKGTGKTTTARIIAKMLNCSESPASKVSSPKPPTFTKVSAGKHVPSHESYDEPCNKCDNCESITLGSSMDVLEIDAASNRGIDDIRELREKVKLAPVLGRYKVYIIDEVHMLTTEAFNALLKTLEEPPAKTVFILCTTDPRKVPETIISRCQKFEFKRAKEKDILVYLKSIAKKEELEFDDEGLSLIARNSSGGFRDAVSLLDQIASTKGKIDVQSVLKKLSLSDDEKLLKFLEFMQDKNGKLALKFIGDYVDSGKDIYSFTKDLILLLEKHLLNSMGATEAEAGLSLSVNDSKELVSRMLKCEAEMKFSFLPQLPLEICVIEWCGFSDVKESKKSPDKIENIIPTTTKIDTQTDQTQKLMTEIQNVEAVTPEEFSSLTMEQIKMKWPEILQAVKPYNHSLESLLKKCETSDFDGRTLQLLAGYKIHKDVLTEPKNLSVIVDCITKVLGEEISLAVLIKQKEEPKDVSVDDELVKAAEKMFN